MVTGKGCGWTSVPTEHLVIWTDGGTIAEQCVDQKGWTETNRDIII